MYDSELWENEFIFFNAKLPVIDIMCYRKHS